MMLPVLVLLLLIFIKTPLVCEILFTSNKKPTLNRRLNFKYNIDPPNTTIEQLLLYLLLVYMTAAVIGPSC
jgi:hypothetical protein